MFNTAATDLNGSINVLGDWSGTLTFSGGNFAAEGLISIGGSLAGTGGLYFATEPGVMAGDILIGQNCDGFIQIDGDMSGDISAGSDMNGFVSISGVFNGDICASNLVGLTTVPSNIDVVFGPDGTICGSTPCPEDGGVGRVLYVDGLMNPCGGGTSWASPYCSIHDAIDNVATSGVAKEIWVAAGTYTPALPGGSRSATFTLTQRDLLFGGFDGTETARCQRDPVSNPTILSGDIDLNDGPGFANRGDNSYHVVTADGVDWSTVLDGFTIRGGYADGVAPDDSGGGMHIVNASPTILNCVIEDNWAGELGGGVYTYGDSSPTMTDCKFKGNETGFQSWGGGILHEGTTLTLDRCEFVDNESEYGGGLGTWFGGAVVLNECRFLNNSAAVWGGAIYADAASATLVDCMISGNSADHGGGGVMGYVSTMRLTNCLLSGNETYDYGGGVEAWGGNLNLTNCTLSGNSAGDKGGGIHGYQAASVTIENSILWGNIDSGPPGVPPSAQIHGPATVSYSCVQDDDPDDGEIRTGAGNIDDNPQFVWGGVGAWTADASTDGASDTTVFTDIDAFWDVDELVGFAINPNTDNTDQAFVMSNTSTTITVSGDHSAIVADDQYDVTYMRVSGSSPCVEIGLNANVAGVLEDLDGNPRSIDADEDLEATVDMGAYEYQRTMVDIPLVDSDPIQDVGLGRKNRYLSFVPGSPGVQTALRVTPANRDVFPDILGYTRWVGPPTVYTEIAGKSDADNPLVGNYPTFIAAELQCDPYVQDWNGVCDSGSGQCAGGLRPGPRTCDFGLKCRIDGYRLEKSCADDSDCYCVTDEDCSEVLHVYGEMITASGWLSQTSTVQPTHYVVQSIRQEDPVYDISVAENYSGPLTLLMSRWGDVVGNCATSPCSEPNGVVDVINDVTAVLNKFKNLAGAPVKARSDLGPKIPNRKINISEATWVLDAFGGESYPSAWEPPILDPCQQP